MSFCRTKIPLRNFHPSKKNLALRGIVKTSQLVFLMAELEKQAGRPKMTSGKRTRKVDTRFTEEEYKSILAMEKEFGISKTDLVRIRLLDNAGKIVVNAKELISLLDAAGAELGRSGNNINQLAKHANTMRLKGSVPPAVAGQFNLLLEQYIENQRLLESALRKIILMLGR
jgi:hypothetical protein